MRLITAHPIAVDSYDHLHPKGAMRDNNHGPQFVRAMERMQGPHCSFLDLGCAGGGLVKDFVDAGHVAYGIEGSDWAENHAFGEWATIPTHLFTADITKRFWFESDYGGVFPFDVITLWDVFEHIAEGDLPALCRNLHLNLSPRGLVVCSISEAQDDGYHVTLRGEVWWTDLFQREGFTVQSDLLQRSEYLRNSSMFLFLSR